MRGFLGFPVSEALAADLAAFGKAHCEKPAPAGDLHLTIKFLSEFSSDVFVRCLPELLELGAPPSLGAFRAGKVECWPTAGVLECIAPPAAVEWQARVNDLLERRGFLKERHPEFRPHVTLGRGKGPVSEGAAKYFLGKKVELRPLVLYRSQPEETGRRHHEFMSPRFL